MFFLNFIESQAAFGSKKSDNGQLPRDLYSRPNVVPYNCYYQWHLYRSYLENRSLIIFFHIELPN